MNIIKRNNFYYLSYSFRKNEKTANRERYLGKEVPENIEEIKEFFLRKCMQEYIFKKIDVIKKNFRKEWKTFPESVKKEMLIDFAIDFTYNTNAIEGSTITHEETDEIIRQKIAPKKPIVDIQETLAHSKVFFKVIQDKDELNTKTLLAWHKEVFEQTKPDIAGKIRDYLVRVGSYSAPDWQDLDKLLKNFFVWYNKNKRILHPVELAAKAHYKFEKIHPFGDGNGRVGRLIIVHILKDNSYPLLIIEYSKRKSYYRALSKSENEFLSYFVSRYVKVHKKYV